MKLTDRILVNKKGATNLEQPKIRECLVRNIEIYGLTNVPVIGSNTLRLDFYNQTGGAIIKSLHFLRPATYKQFRLEPMETGFKLDYKFFMIGSNIDKINANETIYLYFDPPIRETKDLK